MGSLGCPLCCSQVFATVSALHEHLLYYMYRPVLCVMCRITTSGVYELMHHLEHHIADSIPPVGSTVRPKKVLVNETKNLDVAASVLLKTSFTTLSKGAAENVFQSTAADLPQPHSSDKQKPGTYKKREELADLSLHIYFCTICGDKVVGKDNYFIHIKQHNSGLDKPLMSDVSQDCSDQLSPVSTPFHSRGDDTILSSADESTHTPTPNDCISLKDHSVSDNDTALVDTSTSISNYMGDIGRSSELLKLREWQLEKLGKNYETRRSRILSFQSKSNVGSILSQSSCSPSVSEYEASQAEMMDNSLSDISVSSTQTNVLTSSLCIPTALTPSTSGNSPCGSPSVMPSAPTLAPRTTSSDPLGASVSPQILTAIPLSSLDTSQSVSQHTKGFHTSSSVTPHSLLSLSNPSESISSSLGLSGFQPCSLANTNLSTSLVTQTITTPLVSPSSFISTNQLPPPPTSQASSLSNHPTHHPPGQNFYPPSSSTQSFPLVSQSFISHDSSITPQSTQSFQSSSLQPTASTTTQDTQLHALPIYKSCSPQLANLFNTEDSQPLQFSGSSSVVTSTTQTLVPPITQSCMPPTQVVIPATQSFTPIIHSFTTPATQSFTPPDTQPFILQTTQPSTTATKALMLTTTQSCMPPTNHQVLTGELFTSPSSQPFTPLTTQPLSSHNQPFTPPTTQPLTPPTTQPFTPPTTQPFTPPNTQPFTPPTTQPFTPPNIQPFTPPTTQPLTPPTTQPFTPPTTQPFTPPNTQPFTPPTTQPFTPPNIQPFTPPITQPFTPSNNQPFTPPTTQPFTSPNIQPFTPPNTQPFTPPNTQPFPPPTTQPFTPPNNQPFTPPTTQPVTPPNIQPFTPPTTQPFTPPTTQPFTPPNTQPFTPPTTQPFTPPNTQPFTPPNDQSFTLSDKLVTSVTQPFTPTAQPFTSPSTQQFTLSSNQPFISLPTQIVSPPANQAFTPTTQSFIPPNTHSHMLSCNQPNNLPVTQSFTTPHVQPNLLSVTEPSITVITDHLNPTIQPLLPASQSFIPSTKTVPSVIQSLRPTTESLSSHDDTLSNPVNMQPCMPTPQPFTMSDTQTIPPTTQSINTQSNQLFTSTKEDTQDILCSALSTPIVPIHQTVKSSTGLQKQDPSCSYAVCTASNGSGGTATVPSHTSAVIHAKLNSDPHNIDNMKGNESTNLIRVLQQDIQNDSKLVDTTTTLTLATYSVTEATTSITYTSNTTQLLVKSMHVNLQQEKNQESLTKVSVTHSLSPVISAALQSEVQNIPHISENNKRTHSQMVHREPGQSALPSSNITNLLALSVASPEETGEHFNSLQLLEVNDTIVEVETSGAKQSRGLETMLDEENTTSTSHTLKPFIIHEDDTSTADHKNSPTGGFKSLLNEEKPCTSGESQGTQPYLHKKFHHEKGRRMTENTVILAPKGDVNLYINSFQSMLVNKLNKVMGADFAGDVEEDCQSLRSENESVLNIPPVVQTPEFICSVCKAQFRMKKDYVIHQRKHINETQVTHKCQHCSKVFTKKRNKDLHERKHNQSNTHQCPKCNKIFIMVNSFHRHLVEVHATKKSYLCSKCNKAFSTLRLLKSHVGVHKAEKTYKCKYCSHSCLTASGLRSHLHDIHSNKAPQIFKCSVCNETFKKRYGLQRHIKRRHSKDKIVCQQCDKVFSCQEDLARHKQSHTLQHCQECGKEFSSTWTLQRHAATHNPKETFQCKQCKTTFTRKDSLATHMKIHAQQKEYKCHCGKRFVKKSQMTAHQDKHSEIPKYGCSVCHHRFKFKISLKNHSCKPAADK
ncbi:uncharacterized protein LOC143032431 [Oratosquilla oratoria]|uniref:uncharacterized protein LOC143032431 n=1 Tax=Oratosquilla oratoria TaxID=337810 RepID=UPI003F75EE99